MKKAYFIMPLITLLIVGYALPCFGGWIVFTKPAYKGKIIDVETKEPIEGAVVAAAYNKYPIISGPGGGSPSIIKIRETLTDEKGEFRFSSYITVMSPNSVEHFTEFIIFKPGYSRFTPQKIPFPGSISKSALEHFFLEENFGKKGEIILRFGPLKKGHGTYGEFELVRVNTWKGRRKACRTGPLYDMPKRKWPVLSEMLDKEEQWLEQNRAKRR